jgi:hypothetical protein
MCAPAHMYPIACARTVPVFLFSIWERKIRINERERLKEQCGNGVTPRFRREAARSAGDERRSV